MDKIKKLIALTAVLSLFAGQVQAQEPEYYEDEQPCAAYNDCEKCSYLSAALPIGALAVAAVIIATTNRHHHHHSSSSSSSSHSVHSSSRSDFSGF